MITKKYALTAIIAIVLLLSIATCAGADNAMPTLNEIANANESASLLSHHDSVTLYTADYTYRDGESTSYEKQTSLIKSENGTIMCESDSNVTWVYDGNTRYIIYPDGSYGVSIDIGADLSQHYNALIYETSAYKYVDSENLTEISIIGIDQYEVSTEISNADYADATGITYDFADDVPIIRTMTVDAATLDVISSSLTARIADGIEITLNASTAVYDDAVLPDEYYLMANPQSTRTITVVNLSDTGSIPYEFSIADGAIPMIYAPGYAVTIGTGEGTYIDIDDTEVPEYGDLILYLIEEVY